MAWACNLVATPANIPNQSHADQGQLDMTQHFQEGRTVSQGLDIPANTNATNATNANARSFFIAKTVARMLTQRW